MVFNARRLRLQCEKLRVPVSDLQSPELFEIINVPRYQNQVGYHGDIAAICPSTNDEIRPFDDNLALSFACHSAALSS